MSHGAKHSLLRPFRGSRTARHKRAAAFPRWSAARCQKVSTRLLGPHGDRFRLAADAAGVRLEAGGALASTVPAVVHRLSPSAGACGQVRAASRTVPGTLALLACRHVRRRPSSDTGREEGSRDAGDDIRPGEQGGRSRVADADLAVLVLLGPQPSWRQREERLLGRRSGSSGVRIPLGGPTAVGSTEETGGPVPNDREGRVAQLARSQSIEQARGRQRGGGDACDRPVEHDHAQIAGIVGALGVVGRVGVDGACVPG